MKTSEQLIPQLRFSEFDGFFKKVELKKVATINPKNKELPDSFVYIDLESVNKGFLSKEERINKGDAPSRAQRLLQEEDILYQTVRPYQKNNYYFDKPEIDYVASTGYAQIRAKDISSYLYQYLHTNYFVNKVLVRCTGTSYPAINSTDLSKINISIPSIPEQQKIAAFLTDVDAKITKLTKKKTLLEQYKKGVMQKIFNQELRFKPDVIARRHDEAISQNKASFPDWEEKKLGDIATINMGQSPESSTYNSDGIGYYLIQGNADISNRKTSPRNWTSNPTKLCDIGDLILTVRAPVGAIAKSNHKACIGRGVCSIKNNTISNIEFIYQFLLDFEKRWVRLEQGSTFTAVSGKDIKSIEIKLPSIKEQTKIANFLSDIDVKIEALNTKIENSKTFKKGLLQQLFV